MESKIIEKLRDGVLKDIKDVYKNQLATEFRESFYWFILSSNPKFYPTTGFQHFLGAGFVAARLASFLGFNDSDTVTAFLGGVLHDFNKWYVSLEEVKKDIYEKRFKNTNLYNKSIKELLGSEEKAEQAFLHAVEIGLKLESGGLPRQLQRIAELVKVGDLLTGSRESWSISYCVNTLLSVPGIEAKHIVPVAIGKQRPAVSMVSELIEEELEKQGATPLISTPEGMLFLAKESIKAEEVYKAVAEYVMSAGGAEEPRATGKGSRSKPISIDPMARYLRGEIASLSGLSKAYKSIAGYNPEVIELSFEEHGSAGTEDLRVFIVALANIYRKSPVKGEEKDEGEVEVERLRRFVEALQLPQEFAEKIRGGLSVSEILKELYNELLKLDEEEIVETAKRAKDFIISEMRSFSQIDVGLIINKLSTYINIGYSSNLPVSGTSPNSNKVCSICREPVLMGKSLTTFLQKLAGNVIKGRMSTSEVFHPDVQGKPEKTESISDAKGYPVCEICYFEVETIPKKVGYMDGLWAAVLHYYPAIPIDLIKVVKEAVSELKGREIVVIPDYMTSRVLASGGARTLDRNSLLDALDLWFIFGGNLTVTTTALSSAFVGASLPIELEVSDVVIEEAVAKYMQILEETKDPKKREKYIRFTREMRYWLYRTLRDYVRNLEGKKGLSKTSSIQFSRSGHQATGLVSVDVYSFVLKQSEKAG